MSATCNGTGHVLLASGDDFWSECPGCADCCPADEYETPPPRGGGLAAALDLSGAPLADWRCECRCLNRAHESFCYRCGDGRPESAAEREHAFAMLLAFGAVDGSERST